MMAIMLMLLSSCSFVDTLDGHIDDQDNCCSAGTEGRVRACLVRLQRVDQDGWCWEAFCSSPVGYVTAKLEVDGDVVACEP